VLAFDWATGGFRREMRYLVCITLGEDPDLGISAMDVDFLTESEFEQRVRRLREELRPPEGLEPEQFYLALHEPAPLAAVTRPHPLPWRALAGAGYRGYVCLTGTWLGIDAAPLAVLAGFIYREVTERSWKPDGVEESGLRGIVAAITNALRQGEGVIVHSSGETDCSGTVVACTLRDLQYSVPQTLAHMERINARRQTHANWMPWPASSWSRTIVDRWTFPAEQELLRRGRRCLGTKPPRYPGAMKAFRELIELAPGNSEGYLGLAHVLELRGAYPEIVKLLAPVAASLADVRVNHALERAQRALARREAER